MLDANIEKTLHHAFVDARKRRLEWIGVEHLLFWLLENEEAVEVIEGCGGSIDALRKPLVAILEAIPGVTGAEEVDTQPTLGFQRVIQRAIMHVGATDVGGGKDRKDVTGANCLVAIYGEKESEAVRILQAAEISRLDVVNYISRGVKKERRAPPGGEGVIGLIEAAQVSKPLGGEEKPAPSPAKVRLKKLFISYSHADSACLERLLVHLRPLERDFGIACWSDRNIKTGDKWRQEIRENLDGAVVAILLVSADFLASDFVVKDELPPLLIKAESLGLRILPLILKPCGYTRDRVLNSFQSLNDPALPLLGLTHIEQEFFYDKIAAEVMAEIELRQVSN